MENWKVKKGKTLTRVVDLEEVITKDSLFGQDLQELIESSVQHGSKAIYLAVLLASCSIIKVYDVEASEAERSLRLTDVMPLFDLSLMIITKNGALGARDGLPADFLKKKPKDAKAAAMEAAFQASLPAKPEEADDGANSDDEDEPFHGNMANELIEMALDNSTAGDQAEQRNGGDLGGLPGRSALDTNEQAAEPAFESVEEFAERTARAEAMRNLVVDQYHAFIAPVLSKLDFDPANIIKDSLDDQMELIKFSFLRNIGMNLLKKLESLIKLVLELEPPMISKKDGNEPADRKKIREAIIRFLQHPANRSDEFNVRKLADGLPFPPNLPVGAEADVLLGTLDKHFVKDSDVSADAEDGEGGIFRDFIAELRSGERMAITEAEGSWLLAYRDSFWDFYHELAPFAQENNIVAQRWEQLGRDCTEIEDLLKDFGRHVSPRPADTKISRRPKLIPLTDESQLRMQLFVANLQQHFTNVPLGSVVDPRTASQRPLKPPPAWTYWSFEMRRLEMDKQRKQIADGTLPSSTELLVDLESTFAPKGVKLNIEQRQRQVHLALYGESDFLRLQPEEQRVYQNTAVVNFRRHAIMDDRSRWNRPYIVLAYDGLGGKVFRSHNTLAKKNHIVKPDFMEDFSDAEVLEHMQRKASDGDQARVRGIEPLKELPAYFALDCWFNIRRHLEHVVREAQYRNALTRAAEAAQSEPPKFDDRMSFEFDLSKPPDPLPAESSTFLPRRTLPKELTPSVLIARKTHHWVANKLVMREGHERRYEQWRKLEAERERKAMEESPRGAGRDDSTGSGNNLPPPRPVPRPLVPSVTKLKYNYFKIPAIGHSAGKIGFTSRYISLPAKAMLDLAER